MYLASDYFLSDKATVEVHRGDAVHTDVHILIRDLNGSFQISSYMSYPEAQAFVGTYMRSANHSWFRFGDFVVYDNHGGKIDDLKFTLEMM
jgi:hypothetical protein